MSEEKKVKLQTGSWHKIECTRAGTRAEDSHPDMDPQESTGLCQQYTRQVRKFTIQLTNIWLQEQKVSVKHKFWTLQCYRNCADGAML